MQIQKLKLVAFAVKKRIQGYRLLKNPENVSPLSVTMFKSQSTVYCDATTFNKYIKVTKDFSKKSNLKKEILYSFYYYPLKAGDKKEKYVSYCNLLTYESKQKGKNTLINRPFLPFERRNELCAMLDKQRYYSRFSTKLGRLFEEIFGFTKVDYDKPLRPGFFKVLRNNLKSKS